MFSVPAYLAFQVLLIIFMFYVWQDIVTKACFVSPFAASDIPEQRAGGPRTRGMGDSGGLVSRGRR